MSSFAFQHVAIQPFAHSHCGQIIKHSSLGCTVSGQERCCVENLDNSWFASRVEVNHNVRIGPLRPEANVPNQRSIANVQQRPPLIERGAKVDSRNSKGLTPLLVSASNG